MARYGVDHADARGCGPACCPGTVRTIRRVTPGGLWLAVRALASGTTVVMATHDPEAAGRDDHGGVPRGSTQ
jgi:hypothetical protein